MKWYAPFLAAYEKPYKKIDVAIKDDIRKRLAKINSKQSPLASVVIIAHNEGTRIASCLWSLCHNVSDLPFEIIVIDNNSTDDTTQVLNDLGARWYEEIKKGPGHARNRGLDEAKGKYYLCIDADSIYPPYYIQTMVNALKPKEIVCCYGLWSFIPDEGHSAWQLFFYETLRDWYLKIQDIKRPELNVRGMVFAFKTELGKKLLFRTDIIRGEDGSLALAMKDYGKLKFVTDKKARIVTNNNTMKAAGSIYQSVWFRIKKMIKGLPNIFTSQREYKDEESNLIKN